MTQLVDIAQVILAVIGLFAFAGGGLAWIYRRGKQDNRLAEAMRLNTEAHQLNTQANKEVSGKLDDFKDVVLNMFHGLDKRVALLEKGK